MTTQPWPEAALVAVLAELPDPECCVNPETAARQRHFNEEKADRILTALEAGGWIGRTPTDDDLAEIEGRWATANDGPWMVTDRRGTQAFVEIYPSDMEVGIVGSGCWVAGENTRADAEAIAAAPTDVRTLLAAVRTWKARAAEHADRLAVVEADAERLSFGHERDCPRLFGRWCSCRWKDAQRRHAEVVAQRTGR